MIRTGNPTKAPFQGLGKDSLSPSTAPPRVRSLLLSLGILLLPFLAALVAPPVSHAVDFSRDATGTTGSEFLLFDMGPRGIGMGGAYTAITDDAYSLYWNPAGLARVPRLSAGYQSSLLASTVKFHTGSAAYRVKEAIVLAGGWRYVDVGDIDNTDVSGTNLGKFNPKHYVLELGWGQTIYDLSDSEMELNVGATVRWIKSDLMLQSDGYAGDIGIQSRFYTGPFLYDFGAVLQNIGLGQNFVSERDSLPFRARIGGAIYPMKGLSLSVEAVALVSNYPYGALGLEYGKEIQRNLSASVRVGFNSRSMRSLGPLSTMNVGMGLQYSDLSFDYAFNYMGLLGASGTHRFAISYNLPSKSSRRYRER